MCSGVILSFFVGTLVVTRSDNTPYRPDTAGSVDPAKPPAASRTSGLIHESFKLVLTRGNSQGVIRYTLDGSEPHEGSPRYTEPLHVSGTRTTQVRARTFVPGSPPSTTLSLVYIVIHQSLHEFDSNLPLVVIDTFGAQIPDEPKVPGWIHIIGVDSLTGRASLTGPADHTGRMAIEVRGKSTAGRPKQSYGFELRDDADREIDRPLLGMPAESDWVLYGPFNHDTAMMRNPFLYETSNQVGRYAPRTHYCEVFVNQGYGRIDLQYDYRGIYLLVEKIKRGRHRVNLESPAARPGGDSLVGGGYILKMDKADVDEKGFHAARVNVLHVYPKEEKIQKAQSGWIRSYISRFGAALFGPTFRDPTIGYRSFIDVPSFIDFHLLCVLSKDPDGFVFSTYFHKPEAGKLHMGPIWDFDRSMGADLEPRSAHPIGWPTNYHHRWWWRLFDDPDFARQYNARWQQLRSDVLRTGNLHSIIDGFAKEIAEAQVRNYERWPLLLPEQDSWESRVADLKVWIRRRVEWMDSQLLKPQLLSRPGK